MSNYPNIWKIGSRWSETGSKDSSILEIFRQHNVVFVGSYQIRMRLIKQGELLAISDGLKIVALGLALSNPTEIENLGILFSPAERSRFCDAGEPIPNEIVGCRFNFMDLDPDDFVDCRQGTIHRQWQNTEKLVDLYDRYHQRSEQKSGFKIKARTCTLLTQAFDDKDAKPLLAPNICYNIPIYQRPYSWEEPQIQGLIEDLLNAFNRGITEGTEPTFIGTMQIGGKQLRYLQNDSWSHDIIDGQQRLTTLTLILKWLSLSRVKDETLNWLWQKEWLSTRVNNGEQQNYLQEAFRLESLSNLSSISLNPYLKALNFINRSLEDEPIDQKAFAEYLKSGLQFVVIETKASLSKTLQIFDTINTSGLDLNGSDLFKVRFYEYLKEKKSLGEKKADLIFTQINDLYREIDARNRTYGIPVCNMSEILSLLQHDIIARGELARTLHDFNSETFFERFFDTVQGINKWEGFTKDKLQKVDLGIDWVKRIISQRFEWHELVTQSNKFTEVPQSIRQEWLTALELIEWSRYGRYRYLPILLLNESGTNVAEVAYFSIQLAKLFVIYSLRYGKSVHEIHVLIQENMKYFLIEKQWENLNEKRLSTSTELKNVLHNDLLAHNTKAKNLACRLSASIDQGFSWSEKIFNSGIDIEHIEPATFEDEKKRAEVDKEWGDERHRLGNLIILEGSINRSIKNTDHSSKINAYSQSQYRITRNFVEQFPTWSVKQAESRKAKEIQKLTEYLIGTAP